MEQIFQIVNDKLEKAFSKLLLSVALDSIDNCCEIRNCFFDVPLCVAYAKLGCFGFRKKKLLRGL